MHVIVDLATVAWLVSLLCSLYAVYYAAGLRFVFLPECCPADADDSLFVMNVRSLFKRAVIWTPIAHTRSIVIDDVLMQ